MSKYLNQKIRAFGEVFDSKKEFDRFVWLHAMQKRGKIKDLRRQVKYVLIPTQREPDVIGPRGGVTKGKLIEKECSYYADFVYTEVSSGKQIVEDVKGMRTKEYQIKRKLMLHVHGIRIHEV